MKKKGWIILRLIAMLIIPMGFVIPYIKSVLFQERIAINSVAQPFFYLNKTNDEVGFRNIKLKQYEIYNPVTNKYEYYLNEYGRSYLVKRFMETTLIGPEISTLKAIVIGNNAISQEALGVYYPIAGMIFINPFPFLQNPRYKLWENRDDNLLAEMRAEAILATLVHEYSHHLFNSYVSSPIGFNEYIGNNLLNVKETYNNQERKELWNRMFYKKFRKTFFENGPVKQLAKDKPAFDIHNSILENRNAFGIQNRRNLILDYIREYVNGLKLYKQAKFNDVLNLFRIANENLYESLSLRKDKTEYFVGANFGAKNTNDEVWLPVPRTYKMTPHDIYYQYSMGEQVVRKLLLSIYKPSGRFKEIDKIYWTDNFYSNDYISGYYLNGLEKNNYWYRFYSDNVYPDASQRRKLPSAHWRHWNLSKKYLEEMIDSVIGHKNHAELSFVATQNDWQVISKNDVYLRNIFKQRENYRKLKIGGFVDSKDYNYIGYKNDTETEFGKTPIKVRKFNIWYKSSLEDRVGKYLDRWNGAQGDYYWTTSEFINKSALLGKKLYFLKIDKNGEIEKQKKLTSIRRNKYGVVNNFNSWMVQDNFFKKNVMVGEGLGPQWLVVGKVNDGVTLDYYKKQEEVEGIYGVKNENTPTKNHQHSSL